MAILDSYVKNRMDEVRAAMRAWLVSLAGENVPVVDEDQYRPVPDGPFLSLKFLSGLRMVGAFDMTILARDGNLYLHGHREATVSIKARGVSAKDSYSQLVRATDMLSAVQWDYSKKSTVALLRTVGIVVIRDNGIIDTTKVEDTSFPPRAVMDLEIRFTLNEKLSLADQNYINSVGITGFLRRELGNVEELPILTVERPEE